MYKPSSSVRCEHGQTTEHQNATHRRFAVRVIHAETPDEITTAGLGEYAPPDGRLLLALRGNETAGCVALRRFKDRTCEMKRMWVRSQFRGQHIGRLLAESIIAEARTIGYSEM